jgi:hypothetical protein
MRIFRKENLFMTFLSKATSKKPFFAKKIEKSLKHSRKTSLGPKKNSTIS